MGRNALRVRYKYSIVDLWLDYGAIGDGVHDNTTLLQNAVDDLPSEGGAIFIPAGNYKITSTIILPNKNVTIFGEGESSRINYTPADGTDAFYREDYVADYSKSIFRDFLLVGAGAAEATGSGLHLFYTVGVSIENVHVQGFGGGAGIWLQGVQEFEIRGGDYRANNYGIHLGPVAADPGGHGGQALTCAVGDINTQTSYNNLVGIYVDGDATALIGSIRINGVVQGEKRDGILLDYCARITLDNVWFELNNTDVVAGCADVRTTGQCDKLLMSNCKASSTPINLSLGDGGSSCNGSMILNCLMVGDVTLGTSCQATRFFGSNVCAGGGDVFTDNGNYNQRYDYLHYYGSKAWTPGTIADGAFVYTTITMDRIVPAGTPVAVNFTGSGYTMGMWCSAQPNGSNTDCVVTMHNESGYSRDIGAGTVTVMAIGIAIPY